MAHNFNKDWRNSRYNKIGSNPPHLGIYYPQVNYCTDASNMGDRIDKKIDVNEMFPSPMYMNTLNMLPNPLQKNLADTLPKFETKQSLNTTATSYKHDKKTDIYIESKDDQTMEETKKTDYSTAFSGIGSIIAGVFSVITMPFQRRASHNNTHNENTIDIDRTASQTTDDVWKSANLPSLNKNCTQSNTGSSKENTNNAEMSVDCKTAVEKCEEKLARVRLLLANKNVELSPKSKVKSARRPKRVFVQPGSIEEVYENAFLPEDLVSLENTQNLECVSLGCNVNEMFVEVCAPKIKLEMSPKAAEDIPPSVDKVESTDIVQNVPSNNVCIENNVAKEIKLEMSPKAGEDISPSVDKAEATDIVKDIPSNDVCIENNVAKEIVEDENKCDVKSQIIASCEDKVNRLKALLSQSKRNKEPVSVECTDDTTQSIKDFEKTMHIQNKPIRVKKVHSKHHKNPNRTTSRRNRTQMHKNIKDDMTFANEIDGEIPSSVENSPRMRHSPKNNNNCYFDEVNGRFRNSSTTESEDSFQIVFSDSPPSQPVCRNRKLSDCDSEDSFIVFEDSPDSCYTTTDVFGDEDDDEISEESSDYDSDADSGLPICRMNNTFTRTVSDLTDDSLYEDGGFAKQQCNFDSEDEVDCAVNVCKVVKNDSAVAQVVPQQPVKRVRFSTEPPQVRVMRVWSFAARQARAGQWEQHARDRERFKRRIADVDVAISWVFKPQHRARVKFQRFMPWWHAQRRQEAAEKKAREEQMKKEEEERLAAEKIKEAEEQRRREEAALNGIVEVEEGKVENDSVDVELDAEVVKDCEVTVKEDKVEPHAEDQANDAGHHDNETAKLDEVPKIEIKPETKKSSPKYDSKAELLKEPKNKKPKCHNKQVVSIDKFVAKSNKVLSVLTKIEPQTAVAIKAHEKVKVTAVKPVAVQPPLVVAQKVKSPVPVKKEIKLHGILKNGVKKDLIIDMCQKTDVPVKAVGVVTSSAT